MVEIACKQEARMNRVEGIEVQVKELTPEELKSFRDLVPPV